MFFRDVSAETHFAKVVLQPSYAAFPQKRHEVLPPETDQFAPKRS